MRFIVTLPKSVPAIPMERQTLNHDDINPIAITMIGPAKTTITGEGDIELHTTSPALLLLLGETAELTPHGIPLNRDNVVLLPAATSYRIVAPTSDLPIDVVAIDVNFTVHNLEAQYVLPTKPHVFNDSDSTELKRDLVALSHIEHGTSDLAMVAKRLSRAYSITHILCTALGFDQEQITQHHTHDRLQTVLAYLRTNYAEPLSVNDIAKACGISNRVLFTTISEAGGATPMRLLKKIRLEQSLGLLKQNFRIEEAAAKVGFVDPNNFSREFKKEYGITAIQYKKRHALGSQAGDFFEKAESLFEKQQYSRAITQYRRALNEASEWKDIDQLHYKIGLAYHLTGDIEASGKYWTRISSLHYRLLVKLHAHNNAQSLRAIYDNGDQSIRERVAQQAVENLHRNAGAENFAIARRYSQLCKELAPDHPSMQIKLADALIQIGDFMEVLRLYPDQDRYCARALRHTGLYQEHLDRYPTMRGLSAILHLRMNNPTTILSEYRDQPETCVKALVQMNRHQEAVDQFPEYSGWALLALGRYQEVLDQHPEQDEYCMWALALSGKHQQALERAGANRDRRANLMLFFESIDELVSSDLHESLYKKDATLMHAIHLLESDKRVAALEIVHRIKNINDPEFESRESQADLLIPLITFLLPEENRDFANSPWPDWKTHYRSIARKHRYYAAQQLCYSVRYILNEIDEAEYHTQPLRHWSHLSIILLKAMKADYRQDHSQATRNYRHYLEETEPAKSMYLFYMPSLPVCRAFSRWRLNELSETP